MIVWIVLGGALVAVLATLVSFNRFVQQRNLVRNSWSNVDTELRRRYDLVPNLVETVRGYAQHERSALEAVVRARLAALAPHTDADHQSSDEINLSHAMGRLFAVAEAYPELMASRSFLELQRQLVTTEDRIQVARRIFNGNVRDYNRRIESFPSLVVARLGRFAPERYFEIEPSIRSGPPPSAASA